MKTVHEVSEISGVSVRTLHYYDAIGLLKPSAVTQAGYRLYDDNALGRLQSILLFRELQFPLKEIKTILDRPGFDPQEALRDQLKLLELRREQLEKMISLTRNMIEKGVETMDFSAFDKSDMTQYAQEVKERWGNTEAYRQNQQRSNSRSREENREIAEGMMSIFAKFGAIKETSPAADAAQTLVQELQAYITQNYYACTPEILRGLGTMYTEDERFRANIDKVGGEGTAAFAAQAIACYCR